jgi:RNA processing factor Prp31
MNAIRILSNKCRLAAGVDACRTYPKGEIGIKLR